MSGWRLPHGGTIDRARPIGFRWGGRALTGVAGDTLASALLANGIDIVGRSFKYHRPRGLVGAGLEEPNAIVQLGTGAATIPNLKATGIELHEGLAAAPVNARPSAELDLMAVNGLVKRFIPAAFYYKTFMWPAWRLFEPSIRRAAGLGIAPVAPDPDHYAHRFAHAETLVVGGGIAGLATALAAARGGGTVMLVELGADFIGPAAATGGLIEGQPAAEWATAAVAELGALANVTLLPRTMAFGYYDHDLVGLIERLGDHLPEAARSGPRQRLWKLRAGRVILATGAIERPIAFAANDLPGVMLASAAQTMALRHGVACGRRVAIVTNNDSGIATALALAGAGVPVTTLVDSRDTAPGHAALAGAGIAVLAGHLPVRAHGRRAVSRLSIRAVAGGGERAIPCDTVLMAGGWSPAVHLHSQAGGSLAFDEARQAFLPGPMPQTVASAGAAAGVIDVEAAIAHARAIARCEAATLPAAPPIGPLPDYADGDPAAHEAWLDYQNDVTVGDVQLALRENFRSVEHVKRYTTLGMASDQGKTSNVAGIRVMAGLMGKVPGEVGTTRFRPPYDPVTIGAFAGAAVGDDLMPLAPLAADRAHRAAGARMEAYGGWLRPACYPRDGESEEAAIAREVGAVRAGVGLFDASPLGKIEVSGADAATFLERIYANSIRTLKPGRCRYGLMLNENGVVYDDGVCARVAEDHFLVGTTSGHAAAITEMLEEWLQCEWTDLAVLVDNVTTGWAVMNLAGPRARDVLAALGPDIDLAPAAFPHMAMREGSIGGLPCRIQRVSFTGELSYEIAVPWGHGAALWDALIAAGADHGITPFGVESLMVMRIEKGFLHVGSETDGVTLPQDIGFGPAIARKESDFIGRRSTQRADGLRADRRQFVGIELIDGPAPIHAGAHVLPAGARDARGTEGWITSAAFSPTLGRPVALAMVTRGRERIGEAVRLWDLGRWREARIVAPGAYDPEGARLDG